MLQKQEPPGRLEDAINLAQCLVDIVNAAQRKGADYAIEVTILERNIFATKQVRVDLDRPLFNSLLGEPVHPAIWINDGESANMVGVVGQV